jgi:protein-disulfide isomerase
VGISVCLPARAQRQDELSTVKSDVKALQERQQQIIDQIGELKRLVAANSVSRLPGPQPPVLPSMLDVQGERFRGDRGATLAIVEYADFECPYCGKFEEEVYPQIFSDYIQTGKLKYYYRDLPLQMHPHAMPAARAARCAEEQGKFWEMHDKLFANQSALTEKGFSERAQELGLDSAKFFECLSTSDRYTGEIKQSAAAAQKMGIAGTPTFFIGKIDSNGEITNLRMVVGARPYNAFKSAIDAALAAAP